MIEKQLVCHAKGHAVEVREYVEAHATEFFEDLKEWLKIPSVSGDPKYHTDVERCTH